MTPESPTIQKGSPLYLGGKFIESFFGLAPSNVLRLVVGLIVFVIVVGASVALGITLVDTTQSQLVLIDLSSPSDTQAFQCRLQWVASSIYSVYGRGRDRLQCTDPSWNAILADSSSLYTSAVFSFSGSLGCQPIEVNVTNQRVNFTTLYYAEVIGNLAVLYNDSFCLPTGIRGQLELSACSFSQISDPFDPVQLSALRSQCVAINQGTSPQSMQNFLADSNDSGYLCTANLNTELLASQCMRNISNLDQAPVTKASTTFTFSQATTIYPAVINAMQTAIYGSSQYSTLATAVLSMLGCINDATALDYTGPFTETEPNSGCWGTAQLYCNRLCTLSSALRPDLINPVLASYFPRWGTTVPECSQYCLSLNQTVQVAAINRLLPDYELSSVADWVLQFLSRCIGVPEGTNLARLSDTAFEALDIVCLTQQDVNIAQSTVQVNIFVNTISWIGTFQLVLTICVIVTFILATVYASKSK